MVMFTKAPKSIWSQGARSDIAATQPPPPRVSCKRANQGDVNFPLYEDEAEKALSSVTVKSVMFIAGGTEVSVGVNTGT